ncbi:histidine phosphatase family protein [Candidatus Saccharibacteria bacterium]|nr:histidine phosphatase family protein [Candidatus Saccharibacteria bacterium]MBR3332135.1 histidine phosphatase family protein [Candidatus Saccharibacteria bacterium]
MSLNLYFVRHGQSVANLSKRFYDDAKAELTMFGKGQAMDVGVKLKEMNVGFTAIYSSPYLRAMDTCAIALESAEIKERKVIYDDRLVERQFNGLFGKTITHEQYVELFDYESSLSEQMGVETLDHLESRARNFIDELCVKYAVGNILVFSHGIFGLAVYTVLNGRPNSASMYDLRLLKNCEIKVFKLK